MATQLLIGGQLYVPGQPLSLAQMLAISASIQLGNNTYSGAAPGTLDAQAYAQYVTQGGQLAAQPQDSAISAGDVAVNSQLAKTEGAVVQNPPTSAIVDTSLLSQPLSNPQAQDLLNINNRLRSAGIITQDTGLNANTIPLYRSQATPPYDINALAGIGPNSPELDITNTYAATQPGVGARNDDSGVITGNTAKDIINRTYQSSTNQRIPTQPNVLDDYASYTYQISWYLLSPQQYNAMTSSPKINQAGWTLLMQSGGSPLPPTSNTSAADTTPGRSPFFPVDFYIDDLEIVSTITARSNGLPHNAVKMKFKVVEPNGLTLLDSLYAAVNDQYSAKIDPYDPNAWGSEGSAVPYTPDPAHQASVIAASGSTGKVNYTKAQYVLGIKFYGYDSQGNLISPATGKFNPGVGSTLKTNQQDFIIQKLYAFQINSINFRMAAGQNSKGVEYQIECGLISMNNAFGQARGTVPFDFQLSGTTVKQILVGNAAQAGLTPLQDGRVPQATPPGNNIPPAPATQQLSQFGTFNAGSSLTYSDTPGIY